MLFGRKKPQVSRQASLATRPVRLVEPEVEPTDDGGAKLKVKVQPVRWARWAMSGKGLSKTFELDALGMFVWDSCDGKTSVQQIIRKLARQYHVSLREAEVSTIQFLQLLVKKGLVGMPVKEKKKGSE